MELIKVKCTAERKIFPPERSDELGFVICAYKALDPSELEHPVGDNRFTAKGALLPYAKGTTVTLYGDRWEMKDNGLSLHVIGYDEFVPDTPTTIESFLLTLDGCDKSEAARIMNATGDNDILSKLDNSPELFGKAVKNKYLAERIRNAYLVRRKKKEAFFFLTRLLPKNVPLAQARDAALAAESVEEIKKDLFKFAILGLIPYRTARKIAKEEGVDHKSLKGVEAAIVDVLKQNEGSSSGYAFDEDKAIGNTYCVVSELVRKAADAVGLKQTNNLCLQAIQELIDEDICVCAQGKYIYRKETADAEYGIAAELVRLLSYKLPFFEYRDDIYAIENRKKMRLAPEQRQAAKAALLNAFTLLVGGPGTGKTTIEQVIIDVFRHYNSTKVLLVAPTGKAARRMTESCGLPACTVHKALNVSAEAEVIQTDVSLDAGLIIVDECSMLDSQVCYALLKAIKTGTQVIFVGDTNQLPSVGAGNVLFELINSKLVPTVELQTVYRQKAGSTIAINCARIKRGSTELMFDNETFRFVEVGSEEEAVGAILTAYAEELETGLTSEDICLLSPYRKSTATGVNHINPVLQKKLVNTSAPSLQYGTNRFYVGDKVMCMTNRSDVANGDVGYITDIKGTKFKVDFRDGRVATYNKGDLRDFNLAYSTTIHKSQGSEYKTCIIVLLDVHKAMLKRNLIYTAISRAKTKCVVVGTKSALETAILTEDASKRQSRLGEILGLMMVH